MKMYIKLLSAVFIAGLAHVLTMIFRPTIEKVHEDIKSDYRNQEINVLGLTSSVECRYDKTRNKMCTLRNVCYLPESNNFLLVLRPNSKMLGLDSRNDLKTICMSSVAKHNTLFMPFQVIINTFSDKIAYEANVTFIEEPVFLISRFKPDNIMHVIHDDILPLFTTYDYLCSGDIQQCLKRYHLIFADDKDESTHHEWYRMFSNEKPHGLKKFQSITCFDKLSVGLSRESLWFQYGFGEPQGPLSNASINSEVIDRFKSFIFDNFKISPSIPSNLTNVVIFNRKVNRKILNEDYIVNKLLDVLKYLHPEINNKDKIHILDVSVNKSTDIISIINKSVLIVGMHGSAMIYSLFLPTNGAVLELFPLGIQPQHVSPIRALLALQGVHLNYNSWKNVKETNSFAHPDWSPLLGGIEHLSKLKQDEIVQLKEIPAVECCHDPAYLYRMFQDTVVDDPFEYNLKEVLIKQKENTMYQPYDLTNLYLTKTWYYPALVENVNCIVDNIGWNVSVEWQVPLNIRLMEKIYEQSIIAYYVTVQLGNKIFSLKSTSSSVTVALTDEQIDQQQTELTGVQVWIRAIVNSMEGNDLHYYCT